MKVFGPKDAPYEGPLDRVDTPAGQPCAWCEEAIAEDDTGFVIPCIGVEGVEEMPYHTNCNLRTVIGSVAHIKGRCSCFNGDSEEGDDPTLTKREAADAAVAAWRAKEGNS